MNDNGQSFRTNEKADTRNVRCGSVGAPPPCECDLPVYCVWEGSARVRA